MVPVIAGSPGKGFRLQFEFVLFRDGTEHLQTGWYDLMSDSVAGHYRNFVCFHKFEYIWLPIQLQVILPGKKNGMPRTKYFSR